MRIPQALAIVACVGLLSATSPLRQPHVSAAPAKDNVTTFRIVIGPDTKVFNGDVDDSQRITYGSFDDSKWVEPVHVSSDIANCVAQQTGGWPGFPAFWGADTSRWYWMRQRFDLPKARNYAGSVLDMRAYARYVAIFLNARLVTAPSMDDGQLAQRFQLDPTMLLAGDYVLAFQLLPQSQMLGALGIPCNAVSFILTVQAHDAVGSAPPTPSPIPSATAVPTPIPSGPSVSPSFPADDAIVTGTALPLRWHPFRHAVAYLIRIWLVQADARQGITARTVATSAQTVLGVQTAISTARMLKGQYRWDIAALNAAGQLITAWSTPRSLQLE